jgi:hypothetical protein
LVLVQADPQVSKIVTGRARLRDSGGLRMDLEPWLENAVPGTRDEQVLASMRHRKENHQPTTSC